MPKAETAPAAAAPAAPVAAPAAPVAAPAAEKATPWKVIKIVKAASEHETKALAVAAAEANNAAAVLIGAKARYAVVGLAE